MGGTVSEPYTQASDTVARLQEAVRIGIPVQIPGAREERERPVGLTEILTDPVAAHARAAAVFDRVRLERRLETAADAASDGTGARLKRTLSRLWRRALRGPDAAAIVL